MAEEVKTVEEKKVDTPVETTEASADGKDESKTEAPTVISKYTGKKKKRSIRQISHGRAYIQATYNNTIVTLTDLNGNTLAFSSAGQNGFKGPKKSTPYAASLIVKNVVEKVKPFGLKEVNVFVKGVGSGRESAIRSLNANGLHVLSIKDVTPLPHNGARRRKPRRV